MFDVVAKGHLKEGVRPDGHGSCFVGAGAVERFEAFEFELADVCEGPPPEGGEGGGVGGGGPAQLFDGDGGEQGASSLMVPGEPAVKDEFVIALGWVKVAEDPFDTEGFEVLGPVQDSYS